MAEILRSSHTMQCMGWTIRFAEAETLENYGLGIEINIYHREHTNIEAGNTRECHGHVIHVDFEKDELLLIDYDIVYSHLSFFLSSLIPTEEQPEIVRKIMLEYNTTSTSLINSRSSKRHMLVFEIMVDIWLSHNEEEAVARAMEQSMEADTCKPIPAARSAIDTLKEVILIDCSYSMEQCVICLEELDMGIQVSRMPCSHLFHGNCIIKWLEASHLCPLCRFEMPTERCL